jgi:hypothetical protein
MRFYLLDSPCLAFSIKDWIKGEWGIKKRAILSANLYLAILSLAINLVLKLPYIDKKSNRCGYESSS